MLKKNDRIQLYITDISTGGEGIGKSEGFPFFVKNAVIGDEVTAVVTKMNKKYGFAKVTEVLNKSPWRTDPVCPHAERCGGCQIMQLSYEKQLKFKSNMVRNNLVRIGGLELADAAADPADDTASSGEQTLFYPVLGMKPADMGLKESFSPQHFRNKVQFPVGRNKDGHVIAGFYAGRTHYIIETDHCPVSFAQTDKILKCICGFLEEHRVSVYDENTGKGLVRHILLRKGFRSGQILVCLVINGSSLTEPSSGTGLEQLFVETLRKENEGIAGISLNVNTKKTNVILGSKMILLYGTPYIEDSISLSGVGTKDLTFRISPLSFYQVNPEQTEKLYAKALEFADLKGSETVWDLYCGIGTISLFLAQKAKKVYGVEIVPDAIRDAKENAEINGIDNVEFLCGDSADVFLTHMKRPEHSGDSEKNAGEEHSDHTDNGQSVDLVVLDPPRKGCEEKLLRAVMKVAPERIVYVSCDSATLSRDLKILTSGNADGDRPEAESLDNESAIYRVEKVQPVDMFPHTCHVETVCVLSKLSEAKNHISVKVEMDEMDLTAAESKATYQEIQEWVQEKYGFHVSHLNIAKTKRKYGIIERQNYNLPKSEDSRSPETPKEKEDAIIEALKAFKMI